MSIALATTRVAGSSRGETWSPVCASGESRTHAGARCRHSVRGLQTWTRGLRRVWGTGDDGGHEPALGGEHGAVCTRAAIEYREAWEAFGIEWRRVARTGFLRPRGYPLLDEGYDGAMDALDDADNERGEAAIALDRELRPTVRGRKEWRRRRGFRPGNAYPAATGGREPPGRY